MVNDMDVFERFKNVLSHCEVELARSLPICNQNRELIFLYETQNVGDESFSVQSIQYVLLRSNLSGEITRIASDELLSAEKLNALMNDTITPTVFDEEAMDLEDRYYDLYEEYYSCVSNGDVSEKTQIIKNQLNTLLCEMIPASELRNLYYYIEEKYLL